jgi:Nitronate monooxygenase
MPFDTELTRRLGIKSVYRPTLLLHGWRFLELIRLVACIVPVVQGGMQWVGYAELASAVSNAGALGIVCHSTALARIEV